jgi:hypothetical protein
MEGDSSFSKSLAMLIRLDGNVALFNPYLDSIHKKANQSLADERGKETNHYPWRGQKPPCRISDEC